MLLKQAAQVSQMCKVSMLRKKKKTPQILQRNLLHPVKQQMSYTT